MTHVAMMFHQQPIRTVRASGGSGSGIGGTLGCFAFILLGGAVLYFVLRGRGDKSQVLGASHRPMGSGPLQPVTFACPYAKCPSCGGATDKMKQDWDGMRKVTWKCGYCGALAGVQELKDEELPASARQRLGLDPMPGQGPGVQGYGQGPGYGGGGGVGDLLTGMMIGSMLGGDRHHHHHYDDDRSSGGSSGGDGWNDGSSSTNNDWGSSDSSSSDWGSSDSSSDSSSDWGSSDSGGSDSGGSDW